MAVRGVRVNAERDLAIWRERREHGTTFGAMGQKYGITRERVRQVVGREDRRAARQARIDEARKQKEGASYVD
jgi:DNA-directed RNA polymerase sigma subunit (sigma70/sigma32)